ncbi:MAG TPA: type II toxin-antitoxin system Y4mF family antitoxin [Gammaproteobacteria bacterium]|jgi:HTH-type transcriptional regulator/antitoxin HipB|nr:type II toxin-antitoxin system Y4mF family antitoxin [Gammaproteobacteria bacterium]
MSALDEVKSSKEIGLMIKKRRKSAKVTQRTLAAASGTGLKFIVELEQGKPTCQIQKVMTVLNTLGLRMIIEER